MSGLATSHNEKVFVFHRGDTIWDERYINSIELNNFLKKCSIYDSVLSMKRTFTSTKIIHQLEMTRSLNSALKMEK